MRLRVPSLLRVSRLEVADRLCTLRQLSLVRIRVRARARIRVRARARVRARVRCASRWLMASARSAS